ncbi:cytochrome P450 2F2-like [Sebastes umbrosus]|uniref:cytochrome P450 2F2-like n=1 Tax=Sebastes umbrosus TaxID=72105 RepID=UPI00189FDF80|nr:cytochrome P450 2F2-like [Sebastes umbrosus]
MFGSIILLLLCIIFIIQLLKSRRPKNFPPGPPVLPILGNILHLSVDNPLKDFERLRKSYGNVYSLYLGSKPTVVINGMKAMKEVLVTKGIDFAGRPQDLFVNDTVQRKGRTDVICQRAESVLSNLADLKKNKSNQTYRVAYYMSAMCLFLYI